MLLLYLCLQRCSSSFDWMAVPYQMYSVFECSMRQMQFHWVESAKWTICVKKGRQVKSILSFINKIMNFHLKKLDSDWIPHYHRFSVDANEYWTITTGRIHVWYGEYKRPTFTVCAHVSTTGQILMNRFLLDAFRKSNERKWNLHSIKNSFINYKILVGKNIVHVFTFNWVRCNFDKFFGPEPIINHEKKTKRNKKRSHHRFDEISMKIFKKPEPPSFNKVSF